MAFNFMTNPGSNTQTYLISGEVFPTKVRAKGADFAASFSKIDASANGRTAAPGAKMHWR